MRKRTKSGDLHHHGKNNKQQTYQIVWLGLGYETTGLGLEKMIYRVEIMDALKTTGYNLGSGLPFIPMRAAHWCMNPISVLELPHMPPHCTAHRASIVEPLAEWLTSTLFSTNLNGIQQFNRAAPLDFPNGPYESKSILRRS